QLFRLDRVLRSSQSKHAGNPARAAREISPRVWSLADRAVATRHRREDAAGDASGCAEKLAEDAARAVAVLRRRGAMQGRRDREHQARAVDLEGLPHLD